MQKERRIRILRRFVLGLAVAALVAPAAQARVDQLGGGAESIAGAAVTQGEEKGDYPALGDSIVYTVAGYPLALQIRDAQQALIHSEYKGDYPAPGGSTPVGGLSSPSTFDWGDALVGAGAAFGLMLLAGGSALGMRRRQHPAAA